MLLRGRVVRALDPRTALEVSGRMHVDMDLLHVCSPDQQALLPMRRAYMEQKAAELCAGAEAVRRLTYVDQNEIDLVMMSTHGSSGVKDWDLGEVANKVIHASKAPVWLVPTELRGEVLADALPRRLLLVPVSGSRQSESAVVQAVEIIQQRAAQNESELVLLHVVEGTQIVMNRAAVDDIDTRRKKMKAYLEDLAGPIRASGIAVRIEVLTTGDAAWNISDYLKRRPTQLLVMAGRGKGRINRMIFGSVSEAVIHMVKVTPLLLVPGED